MTFRKGVENIVNNKAVEADLDAELRSYVDLLVEQKVKAGLSPEEARRQALIEVGPVALVRDAAVPAEGAYERAVARPIFPSPKTLRFVDSLPVLVQRSTALRRVVAVGDIDMKQVRIGFSSLEIAFEVGQVRRPK